MNGVGSPKPTGKFVSAFGGDINNIDTIAVENGELRFSIKDPSPKPKGPAPNYRARLVNGKLEGETRGGGAFAYAFAQTGDQTITALAKSGNYAQLQVRVLR